MGRPKSLVKRKRFETTIKEDYLDYCRDLSNNRGIGLNIILEELIEGKILYDANKKEELEQYKQTRKNNLALEQNCKNGEIPF